MASLLQAVSNGGIESSITRRDSEGERAAGATSFSEGRPFGRTAAEIVAVAIVYYLTGRLGRTVAPPPGIATVFWPPSGIALASLLILGNRVWPGVWLGAFLSNNWSALDLSSARSVLSVLAVGASIDTGSLFQALLGATLFRRFMASQKPLERFNDSLRFCGIAITACLVSCSWGVSSLWLGGVLPRSAVFERWSQWWIGDTCGVLVIAPLILVWWPLRRPDGPRARWIEAALLLTAVAIFSASIFVSWHPAEQSRYPTDLLILPLIAWVSYRFSQREVTLSVVIVLAIALWGTIHGGGPYAGSTPWSNLPVMQAFIGILSVISITVGAVIAERKEAAGALETSERWLRECQRISRIGSYVLDAKSGCWNGSETLDEILGIGPDYPRTLEGWGALVHPDDRQEVLDHLRIRVMAQGNSCRREYRIVRPKDGAVRWLLCQGEVRRDAKGSPIKMEGTVLDLTDRRSIEARLLQAQKMESIGRLAGGVAHDFNNLLTVINGYGDLVLNQLPATVDSYDQVKEIRKAGERAADLTRQLLAFSRRQVLQQKILSLNEVVRDSDKMLRRLLGEDIELVYLLDPALWPVEADPGQLNQVIVNLAVNARDAMPVGGKLVIETVNGSSADAGCVKLTVSDTGHGMDPATMECVFEPFFTTKGMGKGTGLGLATVHGIVEQSGGHISVRSELGHGAAFTIHLPAKQGALAVEEPPVQGLKGDETVLVVEDEDGVRLLMVKILQSHGYRVLSANGGAEAIHACHEFPDRIDLLITDVVMPVMRGPELAANLQPLQPGIKVLYISGYPDPLITDGVAFGADSNYLQKPFERNAFVRAVRDALHCA
jgi:PAS domain S-box-containing protein